MNSTIVVMDHFANLFQYLKQQTVSRVLVTLKHEHDFAYATLTLFFGTRSWDVRFRLVECSEDLIESDAILELTRDTVERYLRRQFAHSDVEAVFAQYKREIRSAA